MTRWLQAAKQDCTLPTKPTKPTEPYSTHPKALVAEVLSEKSVLSEAVMSVSAQTNGPGGNLSSPADHDDMRHGNAFGSPKTWTGKIVSFAEWRNLSAWERHGPDGKMWNGLTRQWEDGGAA